MKKILMIGATLMALAGPATAGIFSNDADVASRNLSTAADNFEIMRRIVFMNNMTDSYMLEIIGYCSIEHDGMDNQLEVTCMTDDSFKKHYLGLNAVTTYFIEQLEPAEVSRSHYRVTFKPQAIIPDVDLRFDLEELLE